MMNTFFLSLFSRLLYFISRLFHFSYRYRYENTETLRQLKNNNQNFIFAIWHQNLFPGILAQGGHSYIVIISQSQDAQPAAFTCQRLGHLVVRGSSRKGRVDKNGRAAKEEMIDFLKQGYPGAISVDGPKGPAFKVKAGIVDMAKKSQALVVPYVLYSASYWQFRSWDRFRLPKPFSKILVSYGEPINVASEEIAFETYQSLIEQGLNKQTALSENNIIDWRKFSKKNWFSP